MKKTMLFILVLVFAVVISPIGPAWAQIQPIQPEGYDRILTSPLHPKTVFLTGDFNGNLGGLAGADAKCQQAAVRAGLSGKYKAWLADSTGSPDTTFTHYAGPYRLVNGTIVADSWLQLITTGPLRPINLTADNHWVQDAPYRQVSGITFPIVQDYVVKVWTGISHQSGTSSRVVFPPSNSDDGEKSCSRWTWHYGGHGIVGRANLVGGWWTDSVMWTDPSTQHSESGTLPCTDYAYLYCFEQ